jgi:hypothetical protein
MRSCIEAICSTRVRNEADSSNAADYKKIFILTIIRIFL